MISAYFFIIFRMEVLALSSYYTNRNGLAKYWNKYDNHLNMQYDIYRDLIDQLINELNNDGLNIYENKILNSMLEHLNDQIVSLANSEIDTITGVQQD